MTPNYKCEGCPDYKYGDCTRHASLGCRYKAIAPAQQATNSVRAENVNYCNLTDEDIYKMAGKQWDALPVETRNSVKSIELCENLFILREMDRHAKTMEEANTSINKNKSK